ncbi:hypothetical protein ES703_32959 [subsurface metagenome]
MKWLSLVIIILEYVILALPKWGKDKLAQELTIAKQTIKVLTKDMAPEDRGRAIEQVVGSLKVVKDFKKRAVKKLDKAKDRLYKNLF